MSARANKYCLFPFQNVEIHINGDVYTCCPAWNNRYSIGNIYKDTLQDIWNSDRAIALRKSVLNEDYSFCDEKSCFLLHEKAFSNEFKSENQPVMKTNPYIVKFAYDYECNYACKTCRKTVNRLTDEELEILNGKIDSFFLPLLEDAKILIVNAAGDPFASRHSKLLIQKAAEKYPKLKFDFHTNGILCNQKIFNEMNITPDKIHKIQISIHAATQETYDVVVPGFGKLFPTLIQNLNYIKSLKQVNHFEFYIFFVITSMNYKEIPKFIELAESVDAIPGFWEYNKNCCSYDLTENLSVEKPDHPLHQELLEVLKHPKVVEYKEKSVFSPVFYNLIK